MMRQIHPFATFFALMLIAGGLFVTLSTAASQTHHEEHRAETTTLPTLPGQDAFGAIQEIVAILEADPNTNWDRVNLAALREHLIDMNEMTLNAKIAEQQIDGGLEATVTGTGRTAEAIQRMLPAHAQELDRLDGWSATAPLLPSGVRLTVTSEAPQQAARIRNLGVMGLLVSTGHHQAHHLALARGTAMH